MSSLTNFTVDPSRLMRKAVVKQHQRATKSGTVTQVRSYDRHMEGLKKKHAAHDAKEKKHTAERDRLLASGQHLSLPQMRDNIRRAGDHEKKRRFHMGEKSKLMQQMQDATRSGFDEKGTIYEGDACPKCGHTKHYIKNASQPTVNECASGSCGHRWNPNTIQKAVVKEHQRKSKKGKLSLVKQHQRTMAHHKKKYNEHVAALQGNANADEIRHHFGQGMHHLTEYTKAELAYRKAKKKAKR